MQIDERVLLVGLRRVCEVEHRARREPTIGIGERVVELVRDAAADRVAIDREKSLDGGEQVIEELVADEPIVHEAVVGLARTVGSRTDLCVDERHIEPGSAASRGIDPHVEVAMHDPSRAKLGVDLEQRVLRVRLEQDAALAGEPRPALYDRPEDLVDQERGRIRTRSFDQLDGERWIARALEITAKQREARDQQALVARRRPRRLALTPETLVPSAL